MPSRKLKTSVEVYKMIENDVIHYSIRAGGGKDLEMKRIFDGDPIMNLSGDFVRVDSFVLENAHKDPGAFNKTFFRNYL